MRINHKFDAAALRKHKEKAKKLAAFGKKIPISDQNGQDLKYLIPYQKVEIIY
jgi:hypothetical protein